MYYNGNNNYDVAVFLGKVHQDLKNRYVNNNDLKVLPARRMTNFFQNLKDFSKGKTKDNISIDDALFYQGILEELKKSSVFQNRDISTLFSKGVLNSSNAGSLFEQEVSHMMSILATGGTAQASKAFTGQVKVIGLEEVDQFLTDAFRINGFTKKGNIKIGINDNELTENISSKVKGSLLQLVSHTFKKTGNRQYQLYSSSIDAKVDIDGNNLTVTREWKCSDEMQKALQDIMTARFTAKSYSKDRNLHIGDTNAIRAYFSVLSGFNQYDYKTMSSSFMHALNLMHSNKNINNRRQRWKDTATYIYQMRFIYELVGIGQRGELSDIAEADFLLYNENNGDKIFVYSTNYIIKQLFDKIKVFEDFGRDDPFRHGMFVRLEWLGLHSNYKG